MTDHVGLRGLFGVGTAKSVQLLGPQRAAVLDQLGHRAAGAVEDGGAYAGGGFRDDPAARNAQFGELPLDLLHRRPAQRGQREARSAEVTDGDARVEHLALGEPMDLARPIHLAVAEGGEDHDLLPGGRQSGGENHSRLSRIADSSSSESSRGLPLMLAPRELFTMAGICPRVTPTRSQSFSIACRNLTSGGSSTPRDCGRGEKCDDSRPPRPQSRGVVTAVVFRESIAAAGHWPYNGEHVRRHRNPADRPVAGDHPPAGIEKHHQPSAGLRRAGRGRVVVDRRAG